MCQDTVRHGEGYKSFLSSSFLTWKLGIIIPMSSQLLWGFEKVNDYEMQHSSRHIVGPPKLLINFEREWLARCHISYWTRECPWAQCLTVVTFMAQPHVKYGRTGCCLDMLDPVLWAPYLSISKIPRVAFPHPVVIAFWLSVIAFFSFFLFQLLMTTCFLYII